MIKFTEVFIILIVINQIWCDECDTPPSFKDIIQCCKVPLLVDMSLHDECIKEFKVQMDAKYDIAKEWQVSECIFKKTGTLVDGKPNAAELKKYVKKLLDKSLGWENAVDSGIDKCVPLVIAQDAETRKRASEAPFNVDKANNPIFAHLSSCIGTELILDCPEKARGTGDKCDAIKADLKKCSKEYPPRYLMASK